MSVFLAHLSHLIAAVASGVVAGGNKAGEFPTLNFFVGKSYCLNIYILTYTIQGWNPRIWEDLRAKLEELWAPVISFVGNMLLSSCWNSVGGNLQYFSENCNFLRRLLFFNSWRRCLAYGRRGSSLFDRWWYVVFVEIWRRRLVVVVVLHRIQHRLRLLTCVSDIRLLRIVWPWLWLIEKSYIATSNIIHVIDLNSSIYNFCLYYLFWRWQQQLPKRQQ